MKTHIQNLFKIVLSVCMVTAVPVLPMDAASITVPGNPLWTDTGITLTLTNTVILHDAIGAWDTSLGPTGPEGGFPGYEWDEWIRNGFHGQLIGFIGPAGLDPNTNPRVVSQNDPSLFEIGTNTVTISGRDGKLWLAMNDDYQTANVGDNSGSVAVQIDFPPQLKIILSGANVVLTWQTNATGFTLQSTTNLGSSAFWSNVSLAPVVVNGQIAVTNPISGPQKFFRLSQ